MSLSSYKLSKNNSHFTEKETETWSSANVTRSLISDGEGISFFLSFLKYLFATRYWTRHYRKFTVQRS